MSNRDQQRDAFEGMLEYGRSTIRSLFLLNGGAIIALLAFLSAIVKDSSSAGMGASFVPGFWAFIVGVIAAVAATFAGYWNFATAYDERVSSTLRRTQRLAIISGFLSISGFVVGSALTTWAIAQL